MKRYDVVDLAIVVAVTTVVGISFVEFLIARGLLCICR